MPQIIYISDDKTVKTEPGQSILQASLQAGIPHAHACGGYARCSTCRVAILEGLQQCLPRNALEQKLAERLHFTPEIRLACQTFPTSDLTLRRLVLDEEDIELTSQLKTKMKTSTVGEEKLVAILFADIRGFTTFSEARLPYDVVHALNRYFHDMGQVISRNGGYIDNYMGDGLMALFGMTNSSYATYRAVKAGYEMVETMETKVKPYLEAVYHVSLDIGIGVHYGNVVVGTIGAINRKKTTAIGDTVNLASRIEAANKQLNTKLLISQDAYREVKEWVQVNRQARLPLKGKSGEYTLYEIVGVAQQHISNNISDGYPEHAMFNKKNMSPEIIKVIGGALLGLFLMGYLAAIMAGQGWALLMFTLLGVVGVGLLFWEFLLREANL